MGIDFEKSFGGIWKTFKQVLGQTVIQEASQIPKVQKKIEEQKVVAGKNILWQYFPAMLIGTLMIFAIAKFK